MRAAASRVALVQNSCRYGLQMVGKTALVLASPSRPELTAPGIGIDFRRQPVARCHHITVVAGEQHHLHRVLHIDGLSLRCGPIKKLQEETLHHSDQRGVHDG